MRRCSIRGRGRSRWWRRPSRNGKPRHREARHAPWRSGSDAGLDCSPGVKPGVPMTSLCERGDAKILPSQGRGTVREANGGGVSDLEGWAPARGVVYPSTTRRAGGPPPPPGEDVRGATSPPPFAVIETAERRRQNPPLSGEGDRSRSEWWRGVRPLRLGARQRRGLPLHHPLRGRSPSPSGGGC